MASSAVIDGRSLGERMRRLLKPLVSRALERTPFRLVRNGGLNRFQAIDETLVSLKARGFSPTQIVDGGANIGAFTRSMLQLFPEAVVHAIEPQPGCQSALEQLALTAPGRLHVHACAIGAPEQEGEEIALATDTDAASTGAHVTFDAEREAERIVRAPVATLDRLLAPYFSQENIILLKLDLQGFELEALSGAKQLLQLTDVVLTEASFFAQAYEPPISRLVAFLTSAGFELHDIASISHRPRDNRAKQADLLFVRRDSLLDRDRSWS